MSVAPEIYQLKVRLLGISPMIWRRVLVPSSITLRELHGVIQVAMGWEGIHLFVFDIYAVRYGSFELHAANPDACLQEFVFRENERFGSGANFSVRLHFLTDLTRRFGYERFQRSAFLGRGRALGRSVVLPLWHQLSRPRDHDSGTWC